MGTDGPGHRGLLPGGAGIGLKVLLDATSLPPQRTGVGRYLTELTCELGQRDGIELHVLAKPRDVRGFDEAGAVVHTAAVRTRPQRIAWERVAVARRSRAIAPDVFHGPHYTVPRGLGCPAVVTFHDPTMFTHPRVHERSKVVYFTRAARTGVRRARRVIAVSEYAKRGAVEHAGADPDRTDVVPLGVDLKRYAPGSAPAREPYILFVGAIEPRKDVPSLIDAFARLDTGHRLVLAGLPAWGSDAVDRAIDVHGVRDRVEVTGYISEHDKIALLRGADVFVYPSLAEGFGLPVLEALACGAPSITTTGSAPEEVAGDAALLVPPGDVAALRDALERVLGDASFADDLRRRGPERARSFPASATADGTIASYRRAAG